MSRDSGRISDTARDDDGAEPEEGEKVTGATRRPGPLPPRVYQRTEPITPLVPPRPRPEVEPSPKISLDRLAGSDRVGETTARLTPPPIPGRLATARPDLKAAGPRSQLVGRESELADMTEVVRRALEFQAPQLITVIGNQGTGKSRLVEELLARVGGPPVRILRGAPVAGGPRYGAIAELLRDRFSLAESDPADRVLARLALEVKALFEDERVTEVVHFLAHFLGLGGPDSLFLRALGENPGLGDPIARTVLRRFLEVDAEKRPLLVVLDDVQWADDDTLGVLRELGAGLGGSPVVILACGRPELLVRFADWGAATTDHLRVDLRNLGDDEAEVMLRALLARCQEIPAEVIEDAIEMTGGNPHFLEQLVRLFLANGTIVQDGERWTLDAARAAETDLPISIEEAIEARIAALEPDERDVLEKGAVFGNVFWLGAVVALARVERAHSESGGGIGAALTSSLAAVGALALDFSDHGEPVRRRVIAVIDELVEQDYLLRLDAEDSTIPGDVELVFKHNLERELVAKSTEARRLARFHRLAAQWLETKLASRSEEQLEFLAQLYERGGDQRQAANCYLSGAGLARARYANDQAVDLYRKGLAILGDDDTLARLTALHDLGSVLDLVGDTEGAQEAFGEMLRLAWLFDQKSKAGAAHGRLARIHRRRGEYDRAMEHLRAAHDLFAQAADQRGIAGTLDDIGKVHWLRGGYGQALDFHRQALAIRRAVGDRRSIALSLANIGRVHNDSGAFKAAQRQFREALDLRRDIGDLSGVVQSLCDLGGVQTADRNFPHALEMLQEGQQIASDIGDKLAQAEVLSRLGELKAAMGRGGDAVEHLEAAISLAQGLGNRVVLSECCRRLAEVQVTLGDAASAYESATRALRISEEVGSRVHVGTAHRVLAEAISAVALDPERSRRAEDHFRRAIEILAGMKNELELASCYRAFAGFCERTGKPEDAAKLRQRAEEIFGRLRGAAAVE